jgi:hypothetical protein
MSIVGEQMVTEIIKMKPWLYRRGDLGLPALRFG